MPNMSYVRFENTLADLQDCYANLEEPLDEKTCDSEIASKEQLIELCVTIAEEYGDRF